MPFETRKLLRWLVPLFGAGLVWLALFNGGLMQQREYHARLDSLETLEDKLVIDNTWLSHDIELLRAGDPDRIEQEARRLGMIKPGERVFIVTTDEDSMRIQDSQDRSTVQPSGETQ